MTRFNGIVAAVAAAAIGGFASAGTANAGSCVLAGGDATMVTTDLAKFMAEAALKNSISGMGAKAAGPVKMTCDDGIPLVTCKARQRACR